MHFLTFSFFYIAENQPLEKSNFERQAYNPSNIVDSHPVENIHVRKLLKFETPAHAKLEGKSTRRKNRGLL